jgi:hypothetical protein
MSNFMLGQHESIHYAKIVARVHVEDIVYHVQRHKGEGVFHLGHYFRMVNQVDYWTLNNRGRLYKSYIPP